jgi:hypothetical protein
MEDMEKQQEEDEKEEEKKKEEKDEVDLGDRDLDKQNK